MHSLRPNRPIAFALAASLFITGACGGRTAELPRPKNLVLLCVDTLRADHLGYDTAPADGGPSRSPRIDALANSGVVFERAISHASWTLPSFAAMLTSLYTSSHGCWDLESRLPESVTTLPEVFQAAGFDTFGIASHIFFNESFGLQQGFDAFDAELAHKRGEEGWVHLTSPIVTSRAVDWLEARDASGDDDPFLLLLHYFDPHIPYIDHDQLGVGPEFEHGRYRSEIAYTDAYIGRMLDALDRLGLTEDTCVVFVSDHGEAWEEHEGVRRHARSLHTEELRVPLIIRVPGVEPRRVSGMVRTVDLMPTLLEVFGLVHASPSEGQSLVSVMAGGEVAPQALLSEIRLHEDAHHVRSIHDGRWKLIERRERGYLLFDTEADPDERHDLAAELPERVESLTREMLDLIERAEERGAAFERGEKLELSAEDLERLRDVGYIGTDNE